MLLYSINLKIYKIRKFNSDPEVTLSKYNEGSIFWQLEEIKIGIVQTNHVKTHRDSLNRHEDRELEYLIRE